jgi:hypothetical protein
MPVAIYKKKKDKIFYRTGNKIALKKYSAHLLHVWACVLLDKAGKSPKYIKKRLCLLGDSLSGELGKEILLINKIKN